MLEDTRKDTCKDTRKKITGQRCCTLGRSSTRTANGVSAFIGHRARRKRNKQTKKILSKITNRCRAGPGPVDQTTNGVGAFFFRSCEGFHSPTERIDTVKKRRYSKRYSENKRTESARRFSLKSIDRSESWDQWNCLE